MRTNPLATELYMCGRSLVGIEQDKNTSVGPHGCMGGVWPGGSADQIDTYISDERAKKR